MGKRTAKLRMWVSGLMQPTIGLGIAWIVLIFVYTYRLGRLVPALSNTERDALLASDSLGKIWNTPLYAGHKLVQWLIISGGRSHEAAFRFSSVVFAIALIWLFYYVVKNWFDHRVAVLSTFLLASSSWLLHNGRLATPTILQTSLVTIVAYGVWTRNTKRPGLAILLGAALVAWLIYIPGMIWVILLGMILDRRTIRRLLSHSGRGLAVLALTGLVLALVPLLLAVLNNSRLLFVFFGLPETTAASLSSLPRNIVHVVSQIVWRGPSDPTIWLGRLPLLEFFSLIMATLGIYNFGQNYKLDRSKLVFVSLAIGTLLTALGGGVEIVVLIPFVYLLVASGIAFMFGQWFKVFPKNPFARSLAIGLLSAAVLAVSWYNWQHYFVAWPNTPATKQAFSVRL